MIIKNNKGITLVTLVITIILMLILASVTIYYGTDTQENAKREANMAKLQLIQEKVNVIYQKILNKNSNYVDDSGNIIIGQNISDLTDGQTISQINTVLSKLNIEDNTKYKYFDKTNIEQLDLGGLEDKILIDFTKREIILLDGIEYEDKFYYRLDDISSVVYNVQYENKNTVAPEFSVITQYLVNSCKIIVKDIIYSEHINSGEVSYKLQTDTEWIKISGTEFEVDKPGIYDIKLTDSAGNETTKQAYVYVFRDLLLCLDASQNLRAGYSNTATVWEDLSMNNNDIQLSNFDGTATSGWQENYLYFDGVDDYGKSINIINYDETKKLTVQFVDLNGQLYDNAQGTIIIESSKDYNNNYNTFVVVNTSYAEKAFGLGVRHETSGHNSKYKSNTIKNMSASYTIIYNTTKQFNDFINLYVNQQSQEDLEVSNDGNIENMVIKNYELFIGARNGLGLFSTMNLSTLRMYKTELTQDEININYQIDKARYNIQDNV